MLTFYLPPALDTLQQDTGKFVVRNLWNEFAAEGIGEDKFVIHARCTITSRTPA